MWFFFCFFFVFLVFTLNWGYSFMDSENFIPANVLVTPIHIQPEWYFLFAYAILRCIPNKLGGVFGLLFAILILFLFCIQTNKLLFVGFFMSPLARFYFWSFIIVFFILTWLGSCPAETPFTEVAALFSRFYFFFLLRIVSWSHILRLLYLN